MIYSYINRVLHSSPGVGGAVVGEGVGSVVGPVVEPFGVGDELEGLDKYECIGTLRRGFTGREHDGFNGVRADPR